VISSLAEQLAGSPVPTASPSSRAAVLTEMCCAASSGMAHQVDLLRYEDRW